MGSFYMFCSVSKLPILTGDECVAIFLRERMFNHKLDYAKNKVIYNDNIFVHPNEMYDILALGIYGNYDDRGYLTDIKEGINTRIVQRYFGADSMETVFQKVEDGSQSNISVMYVKKEVYDFLISDKSADMPSRQDKKIFTEEGENALSEYLTKRKSICMTVAEIKDKESLLEYINSLSDEDKQFYYSRNSFSSSTIQFSSIDFLYWTIQETEIIIDNDFTMVLDEDFDVFYKFIKDLVNFQFTIENAGIQLIPSLYCGDSEVASSLNYAEKLAEISSTLVYQDKTKFYDDSDEW